MTSSQRIGLVLNVFNRPEHSHRTAEALVRAIKQFDQPYHLLVVCDGARTADETTVVDRVIEDVCEVLDAGQVSWVTHRFDSNRGLSSAVRFGADQIFSQVEYAVFVEDDITLSPAALKYFSMMSDVRNRKPNAWSVSGFTHQRPTASGASWSGPKFSSWGWATWRDRWLSVDWSRECLNDFVTRYQFHDVSPRGYAFNAWFGSDTIPVAIDTLSGRTDSWAIKFMVSAMMARGSHVYPPVPLVSNWGWDGSGRHCPPALNLQATPVAMALPQRAGQVARSNSWLQHMRYIHFRGLLPNKWTNRYHAKLRRFMSEGA